MERLKDFEENLSSLYKLFNNLNKVDYEKINCVVMNGVRAYSSFFNTLSSRDSDISNLKGNALKGYHLVSLMLVFISSKEADTFDDRKKASCKLSLEYWYPYFKDSFEKCYSLNTCLMDEVLCSPYYKCYKDTYDDRKRALNAMYELLAVKVRDIHSTVRQSALGVYFKYLSDTDKRFEVLYGGKAMPFI